MSDKYVINPNTGRSVLIGGKAYRTLIKEGKIKNIPFDKTKTKKDVKPKKEIKEVKKSKKENPLKSKKKEKKVLKVEEDESNLSESVEY